MSEEEFRLWMREWMLRFDKRHAEVMRGFDVMHEQHVEHSRRLDDVIAENHAQRKALLAILDRMQNGGTATA